MERIRKVLAVLVLALVFGSLGASQEAQNPDQVRIQREVRHELWMLPWLSVFDNLEYRVDGGTVTLLGQVTDPVNKSDAEKTVKNIEGVQRVDNQIEVLPPAPMDQDLRMRLFRAIYGSSTLQKYDMGVQKPIRIIVKGGHVTLEGVVDTQADKDTAGIRANSVPGIFSVTNNLHVGSVAGA